MGFIMDKFFFFSFDLSEWRWGEASCWIAKKKEENKKEIQDIRRHTTIVCFAFIQPTPSGDIRRLSHDKNYFSTIF